MAIIPGGPEVPKTPASSPLPVESPKKDPRQQKAQEVLEGLGKDFAILKKCAEDLLTKIRPAASSLTEEQVNSLQKILRVNKEIVQKAHESTEEDTELLDDIENVGIVIEDTSKEVMTEYYTKSLSRAANDLLFIQTDKAHLNITPKVEKSDQMVKYGEMAVAAEKFLKENSEVLEEEDKKNLQDNIDVFWQMVPNIKDNAIKDRILSLRK